MFGEAWGIATWIGVITGLLGVAIAVQQSMSAQAARRQLKEIRWDDIARGAEWIARRIRRRNFDLLVTMSPGGTLLASYMMAKDDQFPSLCVLNSFPTENEAAWLANHADDDCEIVRTDRWLYVIPRALLRGNSKKVAFVDIAVQTGSTQEVIRKKFLEAGFDKANLFWAALCCTKVAREADRAPDLFWKEIADTDMYYPWGKVSGGRYYA